MSATFSMTVNSTTSGSPLPPDVANYEVAVDGDTITLQLRKYGQIAAEVTMSTAEAAALGDLLGGSSGAASAGVGP